MKKIFLFLILLAGVTPPKNSLAAPAAKEGRAAVDGTTIIIDESADRSSAVGNPYLNFFQRSFSFYGGGFWAGGFDQNGIDQNGLTQGFGFANAAFDYSFDVLGLTQKVYASGGYSYRALELGLTLKEGLIRDPTGNDGANARETTIERDDDGIPLSPRTPGGYPCQFPDDGLDNENVDFPLRECSFSLKGIDKGWEVRELYGSFEILPNIILNVGRQRPTWGQFELFSVVNTILPIELQSREFGVSNANLRRPQDMVQLKVFLFERLELSGYAFYKTRLDPLLEQVLVGFASCNTDFDIENLNDSSNPCKSTASLTDGGKLINQDKLSYGARAVWRGDYFTSAFTFYKGHYSLFGTFSNSNRVACHYSATSNVVEDCPDGEVSPANDSTYYYTAIQSATLAPATAYGVEFSVPIGNHWKILGEVLYTKTIGNLVDGNESVSSSNPQATEITSFYEFIRNDNGGRGFVDVENFLVQAGFTATYDEWDFGLNVLFFFNRLDSHAKRGRDLYIKAFPGNPKPFEPPVGEGVPLPTGYVFYNFGADQQHRVGLVGGFLGVAAGGIAFYRGPLYLGVAALDERINWTISADYTTSLSSFLTAQRENTGTAGNSIELTSGFSFALRAGATLEF